MQDSTPQLITPEEFNQKVRGWTISVRARMARNAPVSSGADSPFRKEPRLAKALTYRIRKDSEGITSKLKYQFPRHGVFVHYGVGRGYSRIGGNVIKHTPSRTAGFNRNADDWFDVEIREGMPELATITQEFYGDWALDDMLSKIERFTIQRKV